MRFSELRRTMDTLRHDSRCSAGIRLDDHLDNNSLQLFTAS
jgi:hypothetical protein